MKGIIVFVYILLFAQSDAKLRGFGPGDQDYGYVNVREGAHMFWWMFHTTANVSDSALRPLILFQSGGPGASSCGHGNFMGVGPQDENLNERDSTWVKDFNVLFIDSPVGSGYSYVENLKFLSNDNEQIARDVILTLKAFLDELPRFRPVPLYIFGDGYGGKMSVDIARILKEEVDAGNIRANISGLIAGNLWASPVDSVMSMSSYLYETGYIDENGAVILDEQAEYTKKMVDDGLYYLAMTEWTRTVGLAYFLTDGIDFSNIMIKAERPSMKNMTEFQEKIIRIMIKQEVHDRNLAQLNLLMNGDVKEALDIPSSVVWGSQGTNVVENLYLDFMVSVTPSIESILNNTEIGIHVASGNLNLLVSTPGQISWIDKLAWSNTTVFKNAPRTTIWVNNQMEGYEKHAGNFHFYWINVAGQEFINENTAATRHVLRTATGF